MDDEITVEDLDFILESLAYTKLNFESIDYTVKYHMNPEHAVRKKREQLERTTEVIRKVRILKEELKKMG